MKTGQEYKKPIIYMHLLCVEQGFAASDNTKGNVNEDFSEDGSGDDTL